MKKLLITILIYCSVHFIYAQKRVFGKVIDTDKNPLIGATIYLNNTSIGTTTDEKGEFSLLIYKGYELVASYLGYETSKLALNSKNINNYIVFKLNARTDVLDEVVIKKRKKLPKSKRALYLRMFKRQFLGTTNAAKECKIINESVLIFDFDEKIQKLEVSGSDNIIIKNNHLGYEISYDLMHFLLEPERVTYLGFSRYKKLEGSDKKLGRWKNNRLKAYNGSFRHFLKTIINDDSLKQEGFIVDNFKIITNPDRPTEKAIREARKLVEKKGRLQRNPFQRDLGLEVLLDSALLVIRLSKLERYKEVIFNKDIELKEFVKYDSIQGKISLKFSDYLKVTYLNEPKENSFKSSSINRLSDYQISNINMYVKEAEIVKFKGVLKNPLDVLLEEYWRYEKMADALPLDYDPAE